MRSALSRASLLGACALGVCLLASCLPPPAQIIVLVDAEPAVRMDRRYDHARVIVRGHDRGDGRPLLRDEVVRPGTAPGQVPWPFRLVLTPQGGDAARTYEVLVQAENSGNVHFVQARAISGYAPGQTRVLSILLTGSCVDVLSCGAEQTCRNAVCDRATVDALDLPTLADLTRDASVDASATELDAGLDAPAPDAYADDAMSVPDAFAAPDAASPPFMPSGVVAHPGATEMGLFGSSVAVSTTGDWYAASEPGGMRVQTFPSMVVIPSLATGGTTRDLPLASSADGALLAVGSPFVDDSQGAVTLAGDRPGVLRADAPLVGARFGESVALSADGSLLVVGAPGYPPGGAAFVFRHSAGSWIPVVRLDSLLNMLALGDGDGFGASVAISGDGSTIVVGAPGEDTAGARPPETIYNTGAIYVFSSADGFATEPVVEVVTSGTVASEDQFGWAVAIDGNGSTIVVGSPTAGPADAGAVWLLKRMGGWHHAEPPVPSNAQDGDFFGFAVDISADGTIVAVGAALEDSGPSVTGVSTTPDELGPDSGAVYVFELRETPYRQTFLKAPDDTYNRAHLGTSVAISDDGRVVVSGAPLRNETRLFSEGAVLVFR